LRWPGYRQIAHIGRQHLADGPDRLLEVPDASLRLRLRQLDPREDESDRVCRQGTEAWKRLKKEKSWGDWIKVGEALRVGREWAMNQAGIPAGTNRKPEGKGYNMAFCEWLTKYKLDDMDKGDRSRLFSVMDNLGLIEGWRKNLPQTQRLKLNHPNAVWRKWKADHEPEKDGPAKPTIRDALVQSQEELAQVLAQLQQANAHIADLEAAPKDIIGAGGPWWTQEPEEIVATMFANMDFLSLGTVIALIKARMRKVEEQGKARSKRRRNTPDDTRRQLDARKAEQAKVDHEGPS
jgi:hypothetical protein